MKTANKYKAEINTPEPVALDIIAESWIKLCLFHIKHKKELANSNQNKKAYEYSK